MQILLDSLALACTPPLAWCPLSSPSASGPTTFKRSFNDSLHVASHRLFTSLHQQPIDMLFSITVSLALLVPAYAAPHFPLYRRLDASVLHQNGLDAQAQK